jgi:hypothetical protein
MGKDIRNRRPSYARGVADDERMAAVPQVGMVVSVRTRHDVVIVDPDRFLAVARRAYRAQDPQITEDEADAAVADVYDAVYALIDQYGSLASEHPEVAAGATAQRRMHGGVGLLPGDRVLDRPDGLSPAGSVSMIVLGEPQPVQDYGCFLPDDADLFSVPAHRQASE